MINDIPTGSDEVNMSLFADDSAVYMGHSNTKVLEKKIQQSINIIHNWCNKNGFKISLNKTIGVLFTNKKKTPKINIKVDNESIKMENKVKFLGIIFDRTLTWQSHIEYMIEKCKKRLNLMRALTGSHWGASKKSLLSIYKALIRSILDYGDVVYSSASRKQLNKLNTIQTEALRICCGAHKGTASIALQNECGETPLHLRRLENSIKFGIKIIGSINHPCKAQYKPHWTDSFQTPLNNSYSLYYRTSDFIKSFNTPIVAPSFPSFPPWANPKIEIDLSLTKEVNKKLDNPDYIKQKALELITKHTNNLHIYTDGSKTADIVSAAFTIPSLGIDKHFRITNKSSIYAAELTAITEAVLWILDNDDHKNIVIFSDSLSVLTSIKENNSTSRPDLFNKLMIHLRNLKHDNVTLAWIPSHVDIKGNERADRLAKEALSLMLVNSTNYLELHEVAAIIKLYILNKWQLEYSSDCRGQYYKSICSVVTTEIKFSDADRQIEIQITRLRLGIANTNYHLFKLRRHPNGLCDLCKVKDDVAHLLLECNKENIANILRNKCALFKSDFNLKSLLTEGYLQRAVFSLIKLINKGKIL